MKKIIMIGLLVCGSQIVANHTSAQGRRTVTSAPLQYKQIDYSEKALSFEMEPWMSGLFHADKVMENIGLHGKDSIQLNQQGLGVFNPQYILLGSDNEDANYASTLQLQPRMLMAGALFHLYKQFDHLFFDVKTALINCKTKIGLTEIGGGNGGIAMLNGDVIYNALEAFNQSDWLYGKMGRTSSKTGFDNIQVMLGASTEMSSFSTEGCQQFMAGFLLLEIPTGEGTDAHSLFESQIGTNHCGLGFGADFMVVAENGFSLVAGGNYRYLLANRERRSFDLTDNGPWSRYLGLQQISLIDEETAGLPLPGINLFTQDATIDGRSQVTAYARLQKRFNHCLVELSYNFFHTQKETISLVDTIESGFGIYQVSSGGGISTASLAKINERYSDLDPTPVTTVTSDLDLETGAAHQWTSNTVAVRLQHVKDSYTFGIGASADVAVSRGALSTWSLWLNFEALLPN